MSHNYPKILIIGEHFHSVSGGGITMTNLFKGWKIENIAVAGENILNPNFSVCNNYYQLGSLEIEKRFPFNLNKMEKKIKSGVIVEKRTVKSCSAITKDKKSALKKMYIRLLNFTGLCHYKRKYKISEEFLRWINEFSPDIIYSQLSSLELIRLVNDLHLTFKLPIIIHIMDDWPSIISSEGPFQNYWHKKIDIEFRELINKASLLLSISDAMANEYKNRYGETFLPFHNPIDLDDWLPFSKNNWDVHSTFKILYAGRIGTANMGSTKMIAETVDYLVSKGLDISFDIYSPDVNSDRAYSLHFLKGVNMKNIVPHSQISSLLPSYDLLVLPLDFDKESIRFTKLSMPTKASEFMISGTPILVYAPIETALAKYAAKEQWAYLVTKDNKKAIIKAIKEIYSSPLIREKLGQKAKLLAIETENDVVIRKKFKDAIYSAVYY